MPPRLTMHGHERASLRPRAPGDVFYKTAAISPTSDIVRCGARNGRMMTHAVPSPVSPVTW
jgi:hypothetical protein